jgi:hypothetical protein
MNAHARTFQAKPAVRQQVPLLIGIMSPSGGGKTYSALRLATRVQQVFGGDIYGLDTENNRMLHYADTFKFKHVPFNAPFGSLDYLAALRYCAAQGSRITIVDSMTHEHVGEGGYLETAEAVVDRIAGNDYRKREACKMLGWAKAGPLRQRMIEGIKQLDGAFIFCFRAKEKTKPVKRGDKTEVVDMGFMPIAGEEWVYEMALNCMLPPRSEGVPTWRSDHVGERLMMKLPAQFKSIFSESAPLSEAIGRDLALWAKGSPVEKPAQAAPVSAQLGPKPEETDVSGLPPLDKDRTETESEHLAQLDAMLADAAAKGTSALQDAWKSIPPAVRPSLKAALDRRHKPTAVEADQKFTDANQTSTGNPE